MRKDGKEQSQERILAEHLNGLKRKDFCDFDKPHKRAYEIRKMGVQRAKQGERPVEMSLWKRDGCQTESKAFDKSIVARIVCESGLGLLGVRKKHNLIKGQKLAWWRERMGLDSRKSRWDRMMRSKSFRTQEVTEIDRKEVGEAFSSCG